ncbi:hypothetical protein IKA92_01085 [bacterium]|nr:hypothetical protein [bacterium]
MQKISPLKASLEAFNRFKTQRKESRINSDLNKMNTNPFGITFKGTILQMDVFESAHKAAKKDILGDGIQRISKWTASAWTASINKIDNFRNTIKAYAISLKDNTKEIFGRISEVMNKEIEFDFSKYSVRNLQKRPISELSELLKGEIKALEV